MDPVDGFVLAYARVALRHAPRDPLASSYLQLPQPQPQSSQPQADSAARISSDQPNLSSTKRNGPGLLAATNQPLEHQWQALQLAPQQRNHLLKNLACGSWYAMKIWAFNKVGKGEPSELVTVSTRGKGNLNFCNS